LPERTRERDDKNEAGAMRGENGGSLRKIDRQGERQNVRDDEWACNSGGGNVNPILSRPSAATTAATNIETLEHKDGRGSFIVVEMAFSANGKIVGAFNIKLRVRKNIVEEYWHGAEGERHDRVKIIRKHGKASTAAPGDVTVMITSLIIEGLQYDM
jgi:hypothetical protein